MEGYSKSKHDSRKRRRSRSYDRNPQRSRSRERSDNRYERNRKSSPDKYTKSHRSYRDRSNPGSSRHSESHSTSGSREKTENYETEFSYVDFKVELNRLLFCGTGNDQLVLDLEDFWKFVIKYEGLLKKNGKPILNETLPDISKCNESGMPTEYSKVHCINFKMRIGIEELCSRISPYDREYDKKKKRLTKNIVQQFVDVVMLYLDFKNKEKFQKLKALRKFQSELPVAEYRYRIHTFATSSNNTNDPKCYGCDM